MDSTISQLKQLEAQYLAVEYAVKNYSVTHYAEHTASIEHYLVTLRRLPVEERTFMLRTFIAKLRQEKARNAEQQKQQAMFDALHSDKTVPTALLKAFEILTLVFNRGEKSQ